MISEARLPNGDVLSIEAEYQTFETNLPVANPKWKGRCSNGHEHYAEEDDYKVRYPTLEWVDVSFECWDCCEGEFINDGFYICPECEEQVRPGTYTPSPQQRLMRKSFYLNDEPITKEEAEEIINRYKGAEG